MSPDEHFPPVPDGRSGDTVPGLPPPRAPDLSSADTHLITGNTTVRRAKGLLPGEVSLGGGTLPGGGRPNDHVVQQVGRYRILERLGRGGMATVFKAHDPDIGRDVAIKFLHASLCEGDDYRGRFLQEARAAGGLSHPNIVVVHDVGEIEGRPYMAMEMLGGVSLAEELEKVRTLPVRDVVVMGIQLARALDYAHERGIVHRDIKPGNIMRLSGGRTIKVTDFGIAHVDNAGESSLRTRAGDVLGTPQYMSPEQTRGDKLDGRSDLFSAGIVLYQMIVGQRPFRGDNLVAVATKIATEEAPPIDRERRDVPASLRRVVDRCLAKNPAQRFQSGAELADALVKVLSEIDEVAREKARPRIVPLRVKWAGMMGLIVAVVMGLTATVITQRQYGAMMGQVSDYGASLTRFIAAQNAASVLGEEWEAVEVVVQELMKTRNFERITIIDRGGVVRVASEAPLVGKAYKAPGSEPLGRIGAVDASRYLLQGGPVLGFEGPITFNDKVVGRVALGIAEAPLTQVARLSITLMVVLAVVTVLAVAVAMYFVANWFAKPIKLVGESMAEIAKGRFDHRIREQRRDEFGQLYADFDAMAEALQRRDQAGAAPVTLPSVTSPLRSETPTRTP
ncbi:MAG TPA: protein kinase [Rubrivivax sp.]|jgi:serine/threonine protein kinase/HAMP domain-containing protein|nr:protein kinase [Rubrivivax sp.]